MATIREVRDSLKANLDIYSPLEARLTKEARIARQDETSIRAVLQPMVASAIARAIPDLDAPAIDLFSSIGKDLRLKTTPDKTKAHFISVRDKAQAATQKIIQTDGTAEEIRAREGAIRRALEDLTESQKNQEAALELNWEKLQPFQALNRKLEYENLKPVDPQNLAEFDRPAGRVMQMIRWVMDPAYRLARPRLDDMQAKGLDIKAESEATAVMTAKLKQISTAKQGKNAALFRYEQTRTSLAAHQSDIRSDRDILNEVRLVAAQNMENGGFFSAVTAALPSLLPPEALGLNTRAQLMETLAKQLESNRDDVREITRGMTTPISTLSRAISNRQGHKQVKKFDLAGKDSNMRRHQALLGQRLRATEDIRKASRHDSAYATNTSANNDNWLLWYLIFANSESGQAAPSGLEGHGGLFSGGGASAAWDDDTARNSYFRAEMLGVTPQNARDFGLSPDSFRIETDVLNSLGVDTSGLGAQDFNALSAGLSSSTAPNISDSLSSGFNNLGCDLGSSLSSGTLDMSEISRGLSDLGSTINTDIGGSVTPDFSSPTVTDFGGSSPCSFD